MSSTETTSGSYRIESLKGTENWLSFQVQMLDILSDTGHLEYVDGTNKRPISDENKKLAWDKADRKALVMIRLRVSPSVITYIMSAKTSKEAWDSLSSVFTIKGALAEVLTRKKFFQYSIEDGADMEEEIWKLRSLKEQLTLLGVKIEDNEYSITMLTALPVSWGAFISSIGTPPPKPVDLVGRILQEDARRREQGTDTALVARPSNFRKLKFRKGVYCHNCGREGHIKPECRSKPSHDNDTSPASTQRDYRAHVATSHDYDEDYAFLTIEENPEIQALIAKGEEHWLADTACQRHIVGNRTLFTNYSLINSEIKGVGS